MSHLSRTLMQTLLGLPGMLLPRQINWVSRGALLSKLPHLKCLLLTPIGAQVLIQHSISSYSSNRTVHSSLVSPQGQCDQQLTGWVQLPGHRYPCTPYAALHDCTRLLAVTILMVLSWLSGMNHLIWALLRFRQHLGRLTQRVWVHAPGEQCRYTLTACNLCAIHCFTFVCCFLNA